MYSYRPDEEPPERTARLEARRASSLSAERVSISDPIWCTTLDTWLDGIRRLERAPVSPLTKAKLLDSRRICTELVHVLRGKEPGEGRVCERSLFAVRALGCTQALSSMFACSGGTFIELMATAPWNLLGKDDPPDPRTLHGAGSALVGEAMSWSRLRGCGGRVALQAENPRTLGFYERIGFRRMAPGDEPLSLVPRGESGWSPEILRVAQGCPGPDEERAPWLVLDPVQAVGRTRDAAWSASSAA
jgi:Acetyltransferase (GNAT) family